MIKRLCLLLTLILMGCSSAPVKVKYYLFEQPSIDVIESSALPEPRLALRLEKLRLAKYLRQTKLTILEGNQLYFANQHLWAEKLELGIGRALASDLSTHSAIDLLIEDDPNFLQVSLGLQLKIEHLVATQDGKVILQGQYWLIKDKQVVVKESFSFSSELQESGFAYSVTQQRALISLLAKAIQDSLEGL